MHNRGAFVVDYISIRTPCLIKLHFLSNLNASSYTSALNKCAYDTLAWWNGIHRIFKSSRLIGLRVRISPRVPMNIFRQVVQRLLRVPLKHRLCTFESCPADNHGLVAEKRLQQSFKLIGEILTGVQVPPSSKQHRPIAQSGRASIF